MKPARPAAADDWQRLRRDKRSALIVLSVIVAGLAAMLAMLGILLHPARGVDRASPLYWVLMLPFAWWAASLANYTQWAVRTLRAASVGSASIAVLALALAAAARAPLALWIVAACVAVGGAGLGLILFPGSLVARRAKHG